MMSAACGCANNRAERIISMILSLLSKMLSTVSMKRCGLRFFSSTITAAPAWAKKNALRNWFSSSDTSGTSILGLPTA